ncbi:MAG: alpha/beta fold hydrolase [Paracoccaceae bacterium]
MNEPLVLLPAMMCDARVFSHQINALSRDRTVVVASLNGGERMEEIASALLDQLPPRYAVFGLSFGGLIAMELMRRAPERMTRACLMGCSPLPEAPADAAAREPLIISARIGRMDEAMNGTLRSDHLAPGPTRMQVMGQVRLMAEDAGAEAFVRQCRALQRRRDQQSTIRRLKIPVHVACGEHDTLVPIKRHQFLAELIPNSTFSVIPDAGHLPPLEQPEATLQMLQDWLAGPSVAR